ncbi:hypothetical protein [Candidatus Rhabdochlamydia porcellionis]|jgi:hypothetical protein|uniref:Uncharacterized protein n=1 Tax=Candidatus Rhabdochlamydia porcellionis TaxID=225148 RepID=A0ABX8Z080_9BACT|nr:hypothetical protein [Candidatus Rhabdochlamydia porcellionis]QZA58238.1 hypothetical protein RHAB15C_0000109 [Candidatus Rhabdochlamydia porcellionis]
MKKIQVLCCLASVLHAAEENTGQDFTQPLRRFDVRWKYDQLFGGSYKNTLIARFEVPCQFENQWKASSRLDIPYAWLNQGSDQIENGLDDILFQLLFITSAYGKWTLGFGSQLIFPAATPSSLGSGKYQAVPTFGIKYDLASWMNGAWTALMIRQACSFAGQSNRNSISQVYIQPILNIDLPRMWFLYFDPEIRFNWITHKWFVPFNITMGKLITPKIVFSVAYKRAIIHDFPHYRQEVEVRIGFFF